MATKNITPNTLINAASTLVGAAQAASKGSKRSMNKRAEDKAAEARRATDVAPSPQVEEPSYGGHTHCPQCGIDLSNGVIDFASLLETNGPAAYTQQHHEWACMGCGAEWGPEIAAPSTKRSTLYTIAPKAKIVANHLTLQRGCTVPVGAHWRSHGHKAPNTRHVALSALAELGSAFTLEDAAKALKPLKDQALLGSGTPASYLKAFIKSGYLVEVA